MAQFTAATKLELRTLNLYCLSYLYINIDVFGIQRPWNALPGPGIKWQVSKSFKPRAALPCLLVPLALKRSTIPEPGTSGTRTPKPEPPPLFIIWRLQSSRLRLDF
jgi:hypothetical protein